MVHYIERGIDTRHALEIDAAVKQPRPVKAAAKHGPVEPVFPVG